MAPGSLTVLAPLRPGSDAGLRERLRAIGDDINGKHVTAAGRPDVTFTRSRRIHFARFAILTDPDRGPGRARLLFASIYDGSLNAHLDELVSITSDMDAIWGACEGYTDIDGFPGFIRAHAHEPAAYYIAFRDDNVDSITSAIAARRRRQARQDETGLAAERPDAPIAPGRNLLARLLRGAPVVSDVILVIVQTGLSNVYYGTRRITASLDRYFVFRLFNWITRNRIPPRTSSFSSLPVDQCAPFVALAAGDEIPAQSTATRPGFREDAVAQNQLTVVTVVDPASIDRVRAVLAAIDSYARRLAPPGSIIGISTIHFARWVLIDRGRRLMFVSDYDGSWESYIDEFAEMILSGLDAIWETSFGMPPDGARDLPAFKHFLRSHQVPSDVFFAAYPDETVLNVANDRAQS
jgi:hypothetical protein